MDELLLKQLVRQLKIMNCWITCFGVLFLITLIIVGILLFKLVTFVHSTEQRLTDIQTKTSQTLDVQNKLCRNSSIASLLDKSTDYCK